MINQESMMTSKFAGAEYDDLNRLLAEASAADRDSEFLLDDPIVAPVAAPVSEEKDAITEYYEILWDDAMPAAAKQLRLSRKYENQELTDDEQARVHQRASELVQEWHVRDLANGSYRRHIEMWEGSSTPPKYDPVLEALGEIKASIDRSAVAANTLDFAKRHPFLAGVFGNLLFGKLTGK